MKIVKLPFKIISSKKLNLLQEQAQAFQSLQQYLFDSLDIEQNYKEVTCGFGKIVHTIPAGVTYNININPCKLYGLIGIRIPSLSEE